MKKNTHSSIENDSLFMYLIMISTFFSKILQLRYFRFWIAISSLCFLHVLQICRSGSKTPHILHILTSMITTYTNIFTVLLYELPKFLASSCYPVGPEELLAFKAIPWYLRLTLHEDAWNFNSLCNSTTSHSRVRSDPDIFSNRKFV